MLPLPQGNYTYQQVIDALHSKYQPRNLSFRYDLLNRFDEKQGELTTVEGGEVACNSLANIKRSARFQLKETNDIEWLSDRIQPFARFRMPDGGYIEYPLGIFLLSSPIRRDGNNGVYREVSANDGLLVLKDDKFQDRYTITEGTLYYDAILEILESAGIFKYNIENTIKTLPNTVEFEAGKEKLFAINELLDQINYNSIKVDVYGYYTSTKYQSPTSRTSEYTYEDGSLSITYKGMGQELDLDNVPNKFVVIRSNEDLPPLRSVFTNNDPNSPLSTVNRGRVITDVRTIENIADQVELDLYTQRIAVEASQIYGKVNFQTAIMPFHDINDVLTINYSPLGLNDKFSETSWRFPLQSGGVMEHEVRKVYSV